MISVGFFVSKKEKQMQHITYTISLTISLSSTFSLCLRPLVFGLPSSLFRVPSSVAPLLCFLWFVFFSISGNPHKKQRKQGKTWKSDPLKCPRRPLKSKSDTHIPLPQAKAYSERIGHNENVLAVHLSVHIYPTRVA